MTETLSKAVATIHGAPAWRVRRAGPDDAARLALVAQATFLDSYAGIVPVADLMAFLEAEHSEAAYRHYLASGAQLWLGEAVTTGAPLGYAMVTPPALPHAGPEDSELKRIYALPACHGSGLGAGLMAAAVDAALGAGKRRLLLGVHQGNDRALAFYARQGFVQVGLRSFDVGASRYDDFVLARTLTA